jgi:hypothetical protein
MRTAAAGALLLSLTYLYPYFPQIWSGWPLALSVILVMGAWTAALEYLDRPSIRWGAVAGLGFGSIVLVHGSELLTLLIVLPVLLLGALHRVTWRPLCLALGMAVAVGIVCALPYLPDLAHWVSGGGAYAAGLTEIPPPLGDQGVTVSPAGSLFVTFALGSLGVDSPIRVVLFLLGSVFAVRRGSGRSVLVLGLVFFCLAVALTWLSSVPLVRQAYAITYPWGMHYRLLMIFTIAQALLAGAGGVWLLSGVWRWTSRPGAWARRLRRISQLLVVAWGILATWALVIFVGFPVGRVLGYSSAEDGAAMGWLRTHASPGDVVANDGYADAGIWAPYKAGVGVLLPRWMLLSADEIARRELVVSSIGVLDRMPEAATAACAEHVRWVYYGARTSGWDSRRFPPLSVLQASPALEQVFRQGGAAVFKTRLIC